MKNITTQLQHMDYAVELLRNLLRGMNKKAIVITRQNLYSFVTGGEENAINTASEYTNVFVLITEMEKLIVHPAAETGTLNHTLLDSAGFAFLSYCYYDIRDTTALLSETAGTDEILSDQPGLFQYAYPELLALTRQLTVYEQETYEVCGTLCREALTELCHVIRPDMTEIEVQARAGYEFGKRGLHPLVFLVGNGERISGTRHYLSQAKQIGNRIMIIACIRYRGLILSFTRDILFRPMREDEKSSFRKMAYLGALMQKKTVSGKRDLRLFQEYYEAFCKVGLEKEFREHPCAGYTGYEARTAWITNTSRKILQNSEAIALNPSINGYKYEDTFIMKNGILHRIDLGIWPETAFHIEDHVIQKPMPLILE